VTRDEQPRDLAVPVASIDRASHDRQTVAPSSRHPQAPNPSIGTLQAHGYWETLTGTPTMVFGPSIERLFGIGLVAVKFACAYDLLPVASGAEDPQRQCTLFANAYAERCIS
jgi:hypothetical protein